MEITYNDDDYDIYNCTAEVQITELRMNPYYISVIDLFGIIRAERSSGRSPERSEVSLKFFNYRYTVLFYYHFGG